MRRPSVGILIAFAIGCMVLQPTGASAAVPGGALTIMFGRGALRATNYSCAVLPGSVSLFTVANDLRARGLTATIPMTASHAGEGTTRVCSGGYRYANWADLATFRDAYGWTVVPRGLTNAALTGITDPLELERNICGAKQVFAAHGHERAWGMFAWPQNEFTSELQQRYVTPCYAYGRRYTAPYATNALPAPWPYWARSVSVNGGKCADPSLPCHTFTPKGNRDYMQPRDLAATAASARARGAWALLQFYSLVSGSYGRMGDRFAWDCRSSDPADHWTSYSEYYCWSDYLAVLRSIPAGARVVDPAEVAALTGRTPPR